MVCWTSGKPILQVAIFCPVDVDIINNDGIVIARYIDNQPIYLYNGENELALYVIDNEKYIIIRASDQYTFSFTATDSGSMDFSVHEYSFSTGILGDFKHFEGVTLTNAKEMITFTEQSIAVLDMQLMSLKNGQTIAKIMENGSEIPFSNTDALSADKNALTWISIRNMNTSQSSVTSNLILPNLGAH